MGDRFLQGSLQVWGAPPVLPNEHPVLRVCFECEDVWRLLGRNEMFGTLRAEERAEVV